MVLEVKLNDTLAEEAKAKGLLSPAAIEEMLREELRRRRIAGFFETADRLADSQIPPLTEAEIEREISAARAARRGSNATGR